MESMTLPITFVNKKDALDIKSRDMVHVPRGTVEDEDVSWRPGEMYGWWQMEGPLQWPILDLEQDYRIPWTTAGFCMGKYPVTWELWKLVFDFAEAGGYHFASLGNQGAEEGGNSTQTNPRPVGNKLHPVTMVSWNDCAVWCNAYSEMEGLLPVYRDIRGNILRDSREPVDTLVDVFKREGNNGYRLPNFAEWEYAVRGADPSNRSQWEDTYGGAGSWSREKSTIEVGSLPPGNLGLCDMFGLVAEWGWDKTYNAFSVLMRVLMAPSFYSLVIPNYPNAFGMAVPNQNGTAWSYFTSGEEYMGLRVIRDLEPGVTP
jgi:formylglycine-generating enzyme required for sulfatase activity